MKDPYTEGHSEKVSMWSKIVAQKLGLSKKEQQEINLAARLHDIGKISIPDRILNKPGPLSKEEYAEVKKHSALKADIFSTSSINIPNKVNIVYYCHCEPAEGRQRQVLKMSSTNKLRYLSTNWVFDSTSKV